MVRLPEITDAGVAYVVSQLRLLADLVEAHRPNTADVIRRQHVVEVPSDKPYIERADGGISVFSIEVQFNPGVFIKTTNEESG